MKNLILALAVLAAAPGIAKAIGLYTATGIATATTATRTTGVSGATNTDNLAMQIQKTCAQSIAVQDGTYGKNYYVTPTQMDFFQNRQVTATTAAEDGKTQIKIALYSDAGTQEFVIPPFNFKRVLLTETSVWFLSNDKIREFNISANRITGEFSTYPQPFELNLTTQARGFAYSGGYLYIAHGELGVAVFDTRNHQHYTVLKSGLQPASLAAAVQIKGSDLYILQGAYHPQGFNGVAVVDLKSGSSKFVSYAKTSGVVNPYSSSMKIVDKHLLINNSGWIHSYLLSNLSSGPAEQAPIWLPVAETLVTASGSVDYYMMIEGDFLANESELLACSSVSYVPVGQRKPITEWRMIRKKI